jgi:hypothetical protein
MLGTKMNGLYWNPIRMLLLWHSQFSTDVPIVPANANQLQKLASVFCWSF